MISLLVIVVILTVSTQLISTVGASAINQLLWNAYVRFIPSAISEAVGTQQKLREEVLQLRKELVATSSQDEFAKWAKIRRTLDSRNAELDALNGKISSARTAFDAKASTLRWITTTGLRIILQFWFSKRPMFWIPEGWVPGYVEWGLSFPRAPKGSVSIQVWAFAVGQVVSLTFTITVLIWEKLRGVGTVDGAMKAGAKEEEAKKKV